MADKKNIDIVRLIAHEQFHIFQRYHHNLFAHFYLTDWNLIELNIDLPKDIKALNRTNPDALPDNNWLFKLDDENFILHFLVNDFVNVFGIGNIILRFIEFFGEKKLK